MRQARFLTPSIWLGDTTERPHALASSVPEAIAAMRGGVLVVTPDPAVALGAMVAMGLGCSDARDRVAWAQGLVDGAGLTVPLPIRQSPPS